MKNRIFAIILVIFLSLPISVWAVDEDVAAPIVTEDILPQNLDEDVVTESPVIPQTPYKQPISKRKIAKKFLLAMFAVAASSFIIYLGLSVYNRIRSSLLGKTKTLEGETPLDTPLDMESAVKTFLDKTKWS